MKLGPAVYNILWIALYFAGIFLVEHAICYGAERKEWGTLLHSVESHLIENRDYKNLLGFYALPEKVKDGLRGLPTLSIDQIIAEYIRLGVDFYIPVDSPQEWRQHIGNFSELTKRWDPKLKISTRAATKVTRDGKIRIILDLSKPEYASATPETLEAVRWTLVHEMGHAKMEIWARDLVRSHSSGRVYISELKNSDIDSFVMFVTKNAKDKKSALRLLTQAKAALQDSRSEEIAIELFLNVLANQTEGAAIRTMYFQKNFAFYYSSLANLIAAAEKLKKEDLLTASQFAKYRAGILNDISTQLITTVRASEAAQPLIGKRLVLDGHASEFPPSTKDFLSKEIEYIVDQQRASPNAAEREFFSVLAAKIVITPESSCIRRHLLEFLHTKSPKLIPLK